METTIRLGGFVGMLFVMGLWEFLAPRRPLSVSKKRRWFCNLSIVIVDTAVIRFVFPLAAVGVAVLAQERHWGLFNTIALPSNLAILISVVLLDLVIYFQHVMFHALPILWRFHRMHHTDRDLDVSSGLRFHPVEIMVSMLIKMTAILLIGPAPIAIIIFEVLLNATAMFNHSNSYVPLPLDRILRWVVVTPDMHRVHHSIIRKETDSNFGFNLPWWDRLFGTYRAQPQEGHDGMTIGLRSYQDDQPQQLGWMLIMPFRTPAANKTSTPEDSD